MSGGLCPCRYATPLTSCCASSSRRRHESSCNPAPWRGTEAAAVVAAAVAGGAAPREVVGREAVARCDERWGDGREETPPPKSSVCSEPSGHNSVMSEGTCSGSMSSPSSRTW
eukprot:scaffold67318_cov48-Phaeocystis_antarctica.AAC.1